MEGLGPVQWPLVILIVSAIAAAMAAMRWLDDRFAKARHNKDNVLQVMQGEIDILQIQVRELQIACKGLNGNHFTRTPN